MQRAIEGFKQFTGHEPDYIDEIPLQAPDVGYKFGMCDGLMYETVRDGKVEHYIHKFKKRCRPALFSTHDGSSIHLLGGAYEFLDSGINDR